MKTVSTCAVASVASMILALAPTPGQSALEESPCRLLLDAVPAAFGRCATLEVPENYAAPEGRKIELFFARIPALTGDPAPDPFLLINGGPGGSAVDLYLQARAAFDEIRRERDIVLLDQRGTGRSLAVCTMPP